MDLLALRGEEGVLECLILSTCLRFEIYAVVGLAGNYLKPFAEYMLDVHNVSRLSELNDISFREEEDAVRHLFSVACGLDSKIVGEKQIVAQIKDAYQTALESNCTGPLLNKLFQKCLNVSKNVRTRTGIDRGICSAASLAVKLLHNNHGSPRRKKILILGAGQMGKLLGVHLAAKGCTDICFCSRSTENAKAVAGLCSAKYIPYGRMFDELKETDVLAAATGAPHEVIGYDDIREIMRRRGERPLCILDLADPPDVNGAVAGIRGVHYYSIGCVDELAARAMHKRSAAAREARVLIDKAVHGFNFSGQPAERPA